MARSSHVCSIERRDGVSITEVVMDDMVSRLTRYPQKTPHLRCSAFFPRFHIAQSVDQVIVNCGAILPVQRSNISKVKNKKWLSARLLQVPFRLPVRSGNGGWRRESCRENDVDAGPAPTIPNSRLVMRII